MENLNNVSETKHFELTPGQKKAVEVRDANVLVAAAAGSGKTKVLVDRIVDKVTDKDNPVNVDEFLIVTFTNAAAAQMRDKIREKLKEALEKNPESEHLSLQQLLVNRADICTIDSFCLKLVRENFNMLDIDSSFTIGDPGMMDLVKADVMSELFEKLYDEKDEDFKLLVDIFGHKNQEEDLKKAVNNIYAKASSYPVPAIWLEQAKNSLSVSGEEDIDKLPWIIDYINIVKSEFGDIRTKTEEIMEICGLPGGPDKYINTLDQDLEIVDNVLNTDTYEELRLAVPARWPSLKSCKGNAYDKSLIDNAQKIRNDYKEAVKKIAPKKSAVDLVSELNHIATYLVPLVDLTVKFMDEFMREKKTRRMFEFSDIEHMAHSLVCQGYEKGKPVPTDLAKSISQGIAEIYIDEYQDSNYLQEDILACVSGNYRNSPNMFMVGDVKQSIYRFRMARPDLFIGKYNTFAEKGDNVKILLNNNFRSRAQVLLPINYFFYQLMGVDLGGISYDESVALVPTMEFPDPSDEGMMPISQNTEVMILNLEEQEEALENAGENANDSGIPNVEMDEDRENMKNLELEAHMIAGRIKKLVDKEHGMAVYDEDLKAYRKASYKDIVILTRSMKGVGEQFYSVLTSYGIPVYVSDPKGYFDATEIKVVMSLLSVVDNSRQDIPLAAVLLSPVASINESELARVCGYCADKKLHTLYDKCQLYMLDHENEITDKLKAFFEMIEKLKAMKNKVSISGLIWKALEITGYYTYVSAMPMGHRRKANLDMLLEKADEFEDGYYKGLFNFLRYVDKLKVNQVDFGEAAVVSDDEDVVRIMTMHASKGLEYPIVFVSALGKQFNKSDYSDSMIINSDYYLAMKYLDRDKRYSKETFIREAFKEINKTEGIAEELRVLYVALTRAKEKLIITGHTKKYSKLMEKYQDIAGQSDLLLPYTVHKKAQGFMELIIAALVRYEELKDKYQISDKLIVDIINREQLFDGMTKDNTQQLIDVMELMEKLDKNIDEDMLQQIRETFGYMYPFEVLTKLRGKMSVSDIKKQKAFDGAGYDDSEFECKALEKEAFQDDEGEETSATYELKPEEKSKKSKGSALTGAMRGTIVHKCMELIDFAALDGVKDLHQFAKEHKQSLKDRGIFDDTELRAINCKKVSNMLKSNLGQRMIKAATKGELFKEQQFSIGFPATQVFDLENIENQEQIDDIIIVQGIVDGYFVEDGAIVVMDYKTDACDEETLVGRYKAQLEYYADTLAKLRGLPVKEMVMYSFGMDKEVPL